MFTVGSKVMHPLHGVGVVEKSEEQVVLGQVTRFAVISFQNDRLKLMVNLEQKNNMIRPLIHPDEVARVLEHLRTCSCPMPSRSSERYNINLKKIKSCDVYQLVEVIKDLTDLSKEKKLSPKEQAMLKSTRQMLAAEICLVTGADEKDVEAMVDMACRGEVELLSA